MTSVVGSTDVPRVFLRHTLVRILWDASLAPTFVSTLNLNATREQLHNFVSIEFEPNQLGVDSAVKQLTNIINTAAEMVLPVKNSRLRKKKKKIKKPWFTSECLTLKKRLSRLAAKMKEAPFNRNARDKYRATYLEYRTLLRKEERKHTQNIKQQLISMENKDPKTFWDLVSKVSKDDGRVNDSADKGDENFGANLKKYHSYFSKLYNKPLDTDEKNLGATVFGSSLSEKFRASNVSEHLNIPFTEEEILSGAAKLKNGKASGFDSVLNECLRHGRHALSIPIQKLFNLIRQSGCYPNDWTFNILSTIYKGGQKDDLDNYRGISVGSCFGKMFGLLLTNRLRNTIAKFSLIGPNQIGFLEGNRASDHVFVVNTLVNKIVKNEGKNLYVAFIDLKKAYDSVDRNFLFSKLWALGLDGSFLNIIKSIYRSVKQCVKLGGTLIEPIPTTVGVKQGCNLSPLLFNLFIEDMKLEFDHDCDQVSLDDTHLSHLLFADDLVLFSTSKDGLQRCLDKVDRFCNKWGLNINSKKSNIMIFNKTGIKPRNLAFKVGEKELPITNRYKYLGTMISASGSFTGAIENLSDRAKKAYFAVRKVLNKLNFEPKVALKIFDTLIKPILTYNCEVWTQLNSRQIKMLNKEDNEAFVFEKFLSVAEKQHLRFCKGILGVKKSCSNLAVLGDLGRTPISIFCLRQSLLFFHRLSSMDNHSLVAKAFNESIGLQRDNKYSWMSSLHCLAKQFSLDLDICRARNMKTSTFKNIITRKLNNAFNAYWSRAITSTVGRSKKGSNKL